MDTLHVLIVLHRLFPFEFHSQSLTKEKICLLFDCSLRVFVYGVAVRAKDAERSTCHGQMEPNAQLGIGVNTENVCREIDKRLRKSMVDGVHGNSTIYF